MESKHLALIAACVRCAPPFNRTSMESKHSRHRNIIRIDKLLIEPVWNRNLDFINGYAGIQLPFNRTSMESKQNKDQQVEYRYRAF